MALTSPCTARMPYGSAVTEELKRRMKLSQTGKLENCGWLVMFLKLRYYQYRHERIEEGSVWLDE